MDAFFDSHEKLLRYDTLTSGDVEKLQYKQDPLTPGEREELEDDLIAFCDRELDLLGDIRGLDVLYAGGSSPLWIEGLSQRIGENGTLTAIDMDAERVEETQDSLGEAGLAAPSVFSPETSSRCLSVQTPSTSSTPRASSTSWT